MTRYSIKSATIKIHSMPFRMYLSEGSRYWHARYIKELKGYIVSEGVEMATAHTVGSSHVYYQIGTEVSLLAGDIVIEISYYGGYSMTIHNVVDTAIA